jgi:hypothetical protein
MTEYSAYNTEYEVMEAVRQHHEEQLEGLENDLSSSRPVDFAKTKLTADEGIKDLRKLRDRYIITAPGYNAELKRYMRRYKNVLSRIKKQTDCKYHKKPRYINKQKGKPATLRV